MSAVDPDMSLPTVEELTVPELNLSSPALKAGAHHFGKFCDSQSKVRYFDFCTSKKLLDLHHLDFSCFESSAWA